MLDALTLKNKLLVIENGQLKKKIDELESKIVAMEEMAKPESMKKKGD